MQNVDIHPSLKAIRTTQLGITISIVLVFVKAIAGYFGHSYALIADATESGADIVSSGLLWLALRIAQKCYVRKMGLEYYVDLHLEVDGDLSVNEGHQIAHRVKDLIINEIHTSGMFLYMLNLIASIL